MKRERLSNIELLRIFSILGVIVLHINNADIGGGIREVSKYSINYFVIYWFESLFACAVDLFVLISGYFLSESYKRNGWKAVELLMQVEIFSLGMFVVKTIIERSSFSLEKLTWTLIPTNYFVILYVVTFLVSPYINVIFNRLSEKNLNSFMLLLLMLFSIFPTITDILGELRGSAIIGMSTIGMYGSQWGYTSLNFMFMYCIGAFIRKNSSLKRIKTSVLATTCIVNTTVLMFWAIMNDRIGYLTERTAWEYCNPLIIVNAALAFILMSRCEVKTNKIINNLAKAGFTVYLTHRYLLKLLNIHWAIQQNVIVMCIYFLLGTVVIYMIGYLIWVVYDIVTRPLYDGIERKIHIPNVSVDVEN